ncbi:MAG: xanthine dehydrogenase family protein molybdopterin-binding subunit [Pseudomonadota bacterium]|nr:xanthine dehydrogenase family protein molybdopterin-binding subunit [Pseudomonadota bacterium]
MGDPGAGWIGRSVQRREDKRLLLGDGTFVADIVRPNMAHACFARSQLPHAKIKSVDLSTARAAPGVVAAFSGPDLQDILPTIGGMQVVTPQGWFDSVDHRIDIPPQAHLPHDKLRYVGEAYAVVVADDPYLAEDAAALVDAAFEDLPPVPHVAAAVAPGAALIHDGLDGNIAAELHVKKGAGAAALASAPHRLKRRFVHHRYAAMPIECRGVVADYDSRTQSLTVWTSSQVVHWVRREISHALGMPEERIRVIAPDVGGGFGVKGHVYTEDVLTAFLARELRRPVKWIEDRREHILNSAHSRDYVMDVEIGFDDDGRILAVTNSFLVDSGAYSPVGAGIVGNSLAHMLGPYDIPNYESDARLAVTNRAPNAPYRGAGRPEVAFAMERIVDLVSGALGKEPADIRFRNMIPADRMPYEVGLIYRDGVPIVYDSGDYPKSLERALDALGGVEAFRARQKQALADGRYLGLGLGCYVEGTGVGPFEGATVRIDPTGTISVATGACPQGQGHETVFAQVAADSWGVDMEQVIVTLADTASVPMGYGTIASRSAVTASAAINEASEKVKEKVRLIAAHLLEASEGDLEFRDGGVGVMGVPDMIVSLADIAKAARPGWGHNRPDGVEAGLDASAYYEPPTVTWTYASNAAIVEIDPETGWIEIKRYVEVHDAGVLINPGIADGQIKGGLVQGIGGGMMEEIIYDENGQILTASLADYLIPTALDAPPITVLHQETPSPTNALGVKGLGEGGAIAPPAVIANAVSDALKPFGAEFNATPLRPQDILRVFTTVKKEK